MASSPEDNCSLAENPQQQDEGRTTEEHQPQQHSRRQQRRLDMQAQQKKKGSGGGGKGDKRRQVDLKEDGNLEDEENSKNNKGEEDAAAAPPTHTSGLDATAAKVAQQNDTTGPAAEKDQTRKNPPLSKEAVSDDDQWDHDRQPPITGPVNVIYCGVCGMPPDYCEFGSQWKRCKAWLEQHHPELLRYALPPAELAAAAAEQQEDSTAKIIISGTSHSGANSDVIPAAAADGSSFHPTSNLGSSGAAAGSDLAEQLAENLRLSAAATQEAAAALGLDAAEDLPADTQAAGAKKKPSKGKAAAPPALVSIQRQSRAKRKTMTVIVGLDYFGVKLPNATKIFSKRFACGASVSKNPLGHPPQQVEVQGDVEEAIVEVIESVFNVPSDKIIVLPRK